MTDKKRPLRDRLLMSRYMNTDIIIETVDELDRLSQHREVTGCHNTADLERIEELEEDMRKILASHVRCNNCGGSWLDDGLNTGCPCDEITALRKCLEVLEDAIQCSADFTGVRIHVNQIKQEAGIK